MVRIALAKLKTCFATFYHASSTKNIMAFLLNLLYKSNALYSKQPLHVRILTLVCVLVLFFFLAYASPVSYVIGDVAEVTPLIDDVALEKVPRAPTVSPSTPAAPARAPLCSELPCRMRDPEYVRRYVHNLSVERTAREASEHAFQQYYVTYQGDLHKREVFLEVER
jgi:hypothetical protein